MKAWNDDRIRPTFPIKVSFHGGSGATVTVEVEASGLIKGDLLAVQRKLADMRGPLGFDAALFAIAIRQQLESVNAP